MSSGDVARAMAAAPENRTADEKAKSGKTAKPESVNRFTKYFGQVGFKPLSRGSDNKPLVFKNDGTIQTALALCIVPYGETGAVMPGCKIVHRKYANGKGEFLFLFPSIGTAFRSSIVNTSEDERATRDLEEWRAIQVSAWMKWQIARKEAGEVSTSPVTSGAVTASDDELAQLGIVI